MLLNDSKNDFKIALIGRTNVGKSTLFNRLVRSNQALTFNRPGVTRDTKERKISVFDKQALLIDCPGMFDYAECDNRPELMNAINQKLDNVLKQADVIVFVVDAIEGITPNDQKIASILRKNGKNVILSINKSEGKLKTQAFADATVFGFEDTISISAEHGLGIDELLTVIYKFINSQQTKFDQQTEFDYNFKQNYPEQGHPVEQTQSAVQGHPVVKIAFIGRPNVGKSTLVNALLGADKQLVADFPGLTRESAIFDFENHRLESHQLKSYQLKSHLFENYFKNYKFKIIDTPGVRRKSKIYDKLEKISVTDSLRSYRHADIVVLVIDSTSLKNENIEKQDLTLASNVLKDGKALVIAFNKCDIYNRDHKFLKYNFERSLSQHKDVPFLFISATHNKNLDKLIDTVINTYEKHKIKINTSKLNNWLQTVGQFDILSRASVKLKYITQIGETPPTFLIFVSKEMRQDHERFVLNHFKQHFNLQDIIVKLVFKSHRLKNHRLKNY